MSYLKYLLIAGLMLLPGFAFAAQAMDYYTAGNGDAVFNIFNSISAFVGDPSYKTLLNGAATLGFIALVARSGLNASMLGGQGVGQLLMILAIVGGLNSTVNITIIDNVNGTVKVASNVPWLVGAPAALVNGISHGMTQKIEQSFNFPDGMKMSDGGSYGMVPSMLKDLDKVVIQDPNLKKSLSFYFQDCVLYSMANHQLDGGALLQSGNVWADLASTNGAMYTTYFGPGQGTQPVVVSCVEDYATLTAVLDANVPKIMAGLSGDFTTTGMQGVLLEQKLQASAGYASGNVFQGSGADLVKQAAITNMIRSGKGFTDALGQEQALATTTNSWFQGGEMFKQLAGYIHLMLTAMVLAMAAFVLPVLVMPGGPKAASHYAKMLAYLALWEPLLALVNGVVMYSAAGQLSGNFTGGSLTMEGVPALSAMAQHVFQAGGWLAAMVPAIAWFIVNHAGGLAIDIIGSAAKTAGAAMATGNVSHQAYTMNSVNKDNISQNSYSSKAYTDNVRNENIDNKNLTTHDQTNTAKYVQTGDKGSKNYSFTEGSGRHQEISQTITDPNVRNVNGSDVMKSITKASSETISNTETFAKSLNNSKAAADAATISAENSFTKTYMSSIGYSEDKKTGNFTNGSHTINASQATAAANDVNHKIDHMKATNDRSDLTTTHKAITTATAGVSSKYIPFVEVGASVGASNEVGNSNSSEASKGSSSTDGSSHGISVKTERGTQGSLTTGSDDTRSNTATQNSQFGDSEADKKLIAASDSLTATRAVSDNYTKQIARVEGELKEMRTTIMVPATDAEVNRMIGNGTGHLEHIEGKSVLVANEVAEHGKTADAQAAALTAQEKPNTPTAPTTGGAAQAFNPGAPASKLAPLAESGAPLHNATAAKLVSQDIPTATTPKAEGSRAQAAFDKVQPEVAKTKELQGALNKTDAIQDKVLAGKTATAGQDPAARVVAAGVAAAKAIGAKPTKSK